MESYFLTSPLAVFDQSEPSPLDKKIFFQNINKNILARTQNSLGRYGILIPIMRSQFCQFMNLCLYLNIFYTCNFVSDLILDSKNYF